MKVCKMSAMYKLLVLLVVNVIVVFSKLPPVKKCKITDSACLKVAAQDAVPTFVSGMQEIGAEVLDPMKVDYIKVDLAGLKLNLDNVIVKGLKKAAIDKISVDLEKKKALVSWDCDIHFKGHYKASGKLLILPISGDGEMTIKLKKLHIDMTLDFDLTKNSDGKDFVDLKSYSFNFEVRENAHFEASGLFQGNKFLSDAMVRFMNENWKILVHEFGHPMLEKPNKKIYETIKNYLKTQALEEIANV